MEVVETLASRIVEKMGKHYFLLLDYRIRVRSQMRQILGSFCSQLHVQLERVLLEAQVREKC